MVKIKKEKLKNLPARESLHAQIASCAEARGMTIIGLHERILRSWLEENFFIGNPTSSKLIKK